ncbi:MAG: DUF547 domain-containing protein [Gemmatimonadaceae bacterium]
MRSQSTFDHASFDSLLHRYVVNGMAAYDGFKRSPEFAAYLQRLAHFDPVTLPREERLAFWINAYNAYTIELMCAAMGCPPLRSDAYTGAKLNQQLDDQARTFLLKSPTKNRVDVSSRKVYVSMIFNLYKDDFGGSDAAIGSFIARFYPPGAAKQLLESGDFKLIETPYDWMLNSQANAVRHR